MDNRLASTIALQLLPDSEPLGPERRAVARSLAALLPDDIGETWAVVEVRPILAGPDAAVDEEAESWLIAMASEPTTVWTAQVTAAADPKYEWPKVAVARFGRLAWRISAVADRIDRDNAGREIVVRGWGLSLDPRAVGFRTEHTVLMSPNRSRAEQLGRALASESGWDIGDVEPDPELL
jgi:hypothetical protein